MKISFMRKINVIFTGRYLKIWYAACIVMIIVMLVVWKINERVSKFELTIYNSDGTVEQRLIVHKSQISLYNNSIIVNDSKTPVTKSFRPIKR